MRSNQHNNMDMCLSNPNVGVVGASSQLDCDEFVFQKDGVILTKAATAGLGLSPAGLEGFGIQAIPAEHAGFFVIGAIATAALVDAVFVFCQSPEILPISIANGGLDDNGGGFTWPIFDETSLPIQPIAQIYLENRTTNQSFDPGSDFWSLKNPFVSSLITRPAKPALP